MADSQLGVQLAVEDDTPVIQVGDRRLKLNVFARDPGSIDTDAEEVTAEIDSDPDMGAWWIVYEDDLGGYIEVQPELMPDE